MSETLATPTPGEQPMPARATTPGPDPFGLANVPPPAPPAPLTTDQLAAQVGAGAFTPPQSNGSASSYLDSLNLEGDPTLLKRDVLAKQTVRAKILGITSEYDKEREWDNVQVRLALEVPAKDIDGGTVHPGFAFSQFLKLARNPKQESHATMTRISRENLLRLKLAACGLKATKDTREKGKAISWAQLVGKSVLVNVDVREYQGAPTQEIGGYAPVA